MYLIEVYVTNASLNVNKTFTYYSDFYIENYKRVSIIFNRSKNAAIVVNSIQFDSLENKEKELGFKLNKIIEVIDDIPIIDDKQYKLAKWLSETTVSPFIACLNTMLPKNLRTSKSTSNPIMISFIKKNNIDYKFTKKQKEVFDTLKDGMLLKEANNLSSSIIKKFIENNVIDVYKKEREFVDKDIVHKTNFKKLTSDQEKAYTSIISSDKNISLLHGVTGSGKTEIYLHLAKYYIENKKEVLILVPEISLTPQMIERVKERFDNVVFYHSNLTDQERYEQYKKIKNKEASIVVGTRSSIFLPFNDLGLIIIDEEHDLSYKQDNMPCYNAINVAKKLINMSNAKLVLASATPSFDSYTRAKKGEYNFLTLTKRINNMFPNIEIVNLQDEVRNSKSYIISNKLKKELDNVISNKEQALILLNRRGYSPIVKCGECFSTLLCQDCDIPLNYHKDEKVLKCHQCGRTYKLINKCPKCGSNKLLFYGYGTKKVEEELKSLYPDANIERMDRDNINKKNSHKDILNRFGQNKIDILIGTQMIAKGLDFPNVTLVGILNADSGLMHQDYNSTKVTFDLLMQASGRSGRANKTGKCIIQVFNPDHFVINSIVKQDYEYFYNIEMNYRNKLHYPPYSHIGEIILSDINTTRLNKSTDIFFKSLNNDNNKIYKPFDLIKINKLHRKRIIILDKNYQNLLSNIWNTVNNYLNMKNLSKIKVDIDPLYLE